MSKHTHSHGIETASMLIDQRRIPEDQRFDMLQQMSSEEKARFLGTPHSLRRYESVNLPLTSADVPALADGWISRPGGQARRDFSVQDAMKLEDCSGEHIPQYKSILVSDFTSSRCKS